VKEKKMLVEKTRNKEQTKEEKKKQEEGKKRGENFRNLREGWANERKKKPHLNIWFDLGSSQKQSKQTHPQLVLSWVLGHSNPLVAYHCCYTIILNNFSINFF
jgi:hypothetical protein